MLFDQIATLARVSRQHFPLLQRAQERFQRARHSIDIAQQCVPQRFARGDLPVCGGGDLPRQRFTANQMGKIGRGQVVDAKVMAIAGPHVLGEGGGGTTGGKMVGDPRHTAAAQRLVAHFAHAVIHHLVEIKRIGLFALPQEQQVMHPTRLEHVGPIAAVVTFTHHIPLSRSHDIGAGNSKTSNSKICGNKCAYPLRRPFPKARYGLFAATRNIRSREFARAALPMPHSPGSQRREVNE